MTSFYRFTALWGSRSGSLLFWSFLMAAFSAASIVLNWRSQRRLMPYAIVFMMATVAFFVGLVLFIDNPFERHWIVDGMLVSDVLVPDGATAPTAEYLAETAKGLNPLLRHFGMAYHPPTLYIGFVGFVIPFAYAMAALASGDTSSNWIKAGRFWALISWLFLAIGLILGGRWAYDVLGWGGYWGWDPVENAALLPWLVGTALLHSMIIQEKRGMFKVWSMFLVIFTFSAVIFGTFATRSGLVSSVHAFGKSPIGWPMLLFWGTMTLTGIGLVLWRMNRGELRDERPLTGLLSRETLFVINNLVFLALFLIVFWGSFGAPIISELFLDTEITLGPEFFWQFTVPFFIAAFILMGLAPLSSWRKTSPKKLGRSIVIPVILTMILLVLFILYEMTDLLAIIGYGVTGFAGFVALYETYRGAAARRKRFDENWLQATWALSRRNPHRYGGYLIHLGIVVLGIGVVGSTLYQDETQRTLRRGQSLEIKGYEMRYDNITYNVTADDGAFIETEFNLVTGEIEHGKYLSSKELNQDIAIVPLNYIDGRDQVDTYLFHGINPVDKNAYDAAHTNWLTQDDWDVFNYLKLMPTGRIMDIAHVTVLRNGREIARLNPRCDKYYNSNGLPSAQSMNIPGVRSTLRNDFYVLLADCRQPAARQQDIMTFKVYVNPLINLVWTGGFILILGTLLAVWPPRKRSSRQS